MLTTKKVSLGIIGSILILIFSQVSAELIETLLVLFKVPEFISIAISGIIYIFLTYFLLKQFVIKFFHQNLNDFGIGHFHVKWKWVIIGLLLPVVVTVIYLSIPGHIISTHKSTLETLAVISRGIFFTGFGAGFVEEMVFRGIIMTLVKEKWGMMISIVIPSLLFGLVHIIGMSFNLLSILLVMLAGTMVGVMFSLIAYESKTVWNNALVHSLWNSVIISGIFTISTKVDPYNISHYLLRTKSFLITGGQFGIESSLIALLGYSLVAYYGYSELKRG